MGTTSRWRSRIGTAPKPRRRKKSFQTFLQKYPKDPLARKAKQQLREVQEVIAEGDYRVGYYYYVKGDKRAAAARLIGVTKRYPLYSKSDKALWMLGDIFEKSEHKEVRGCITRNREELSVVAVGAATPRPKLVPIRCRCRSPIRRRGMDDRGTEYAAADATA